MALQGRYRTHDYMFTDAYLKEFTVRKNNCWYPPEPDDYQDQQSAVNSGAWPKAHRCAGPKVKQEQCKDRKEGDGSLR